MSHRVDAGMQPVETTNLYSVLNCSCPQSENSQLLAAHHSVLSPSELCDPRVHRPLLPTSRPSH
jgi:hypothetical protein